MTNLLPRTSGASFGSVLADSGLYMTRQLKLLLLQSTKGIRREIRALLNGPAVLMSAAGTPLCRYKALKVLQKYDNYSNSRVAFWLGRGCGFPRSFAMLANWVAYRPFRRSRTACAHCGASGTGQALRPSPQLSTGARDTSRSRGSGNACLATRVCPGTHPRSCLCSYSGVLSLALATGTNRFLLHAGRTCSMPAFVPPRFGGCRAPRPPSPCLPKKPCPTPVPLCCDDILGQLRRRWLHGAGPLSLFLLVCRAGGTGGRHGAAILRWVLTFGLCLHPGSVCDLLSSGWSSLLVFGFALAGVALDRCLWEAHLGSTSGGSRRCKSP